MIIYGKIVHLVSHSRTCVCTGSHGTWRPYGEAAPRLIEAPMLHATERQVRRVSDT